jgi:hypothetical protein
LYNPIHNQLNPIFMAKNVSAVFKFQGTIEDVTHVDSQRYGHHVRARKNSKTPFVMTPPLAKSKTQMQLCNQYAKPVYRALRPEAHDGGLWSRLLKLFFAELEAGRPLGLECLKGAECNLQHLLSQVIAGGYDFSATREQNELRLRVLLHQHPVVNDQMPRTGYQLRFVVIIPDAENGTVYKKEVLGPLTKYDAALEAVDLTLHLPATDAPCMLLMGIVPHLQGEGAARIMSDSGMKVVWAADRRVLEVAEMEADVEIEADVPDAGTSVAAGNAQNNAYLLPVEINGNVRVTITQSTFLYNVTENKILFTGSAYGDADHGCFGPGKTGNSCQPPGYKTWCCSYPAACVNHT